MRIETAYFDSNAYTQIMDKSMRFVRSVLVDVSIEKEVGEHEQEIIPVPITKMQNGYTYFL